MTSIQKIFGIIGLKHDRIRGDGFPPFSCYLCCPIHGVKKFQTFSALFLLSVLCLTIAPRSVFHFHDHEAETIDFICHDECDVHLSNEHQHCELLQLAPPVFFHHFTAWDFNPSPVYFQFPASFTKHAEYSFSEFLFFRGPPVVA